MTTPFFNLNGFILWQNTESGIQYYDIISYDLTNTLTAVTLASIVNLRCTRNIKNGTVLTLPSGLSAIKRIMIRNWTDLQTINMPTDTAFQTSVTDVSIEGTSINTFVFDMGSSGTCKSLHLSNNPYMRSISFAGTSPIPLINLFINNCPLNQLSLASEIFPNLVELYLSGTNIVSLGGYTMASLRTLFISPKFLNQNFDSTAAPVTTSVIVRDDVILTYNQLHVHTITL